MNIKTVIAAFAFIAIPALTFAQSTKSNEQLSKEFKSQIEILSAEVKTLKAKLKAEPTNTDLISEKASKEAELKKIKDQKKTVDAAIKAAKTSKKETEEAEKAQKKNESASKDAERLKAGNASMAGKSNELVSDELDNKIDILNAEIKTLKAKKKANPNDSSIAAEIAKKETAVKEAKRQKKTIDTAIKANKNSKKQTAQAEKAQKKNEKAHQNAEEMKSNM